MKKFISALAMVLASTVHAADAPPTAFPVISIPSALMGVLADSNVEELCTISAYSFAMCDANLYNTTNAIVQYLDVGYTRACERGHDQGYADAEYALSKLPKAQQDAITNCQYDFIGEE